jgi:hypothetical protein
MSSFQTAKSTWATQKPRVIALAIGLIVGPFISNYFGWQVTSRSAQAELNAGIVEQQARFCDARARSDVTTPAKLGWEDRYTLAKKWAIMPGATEAQSGVATACAGKLAA